MNLKTTYGSKYRVTIDESYKHETEDGKTQNEWMYHEIKGKYGYLYPYSADQMAITFTSNIVANRFDGRNWKIIQNGEDERTVLIPKEAIDEVLQAIKPRRKRQITEEMREKGRILAQKHGFHKK